MLFGGFQVADDTTINALQSRNGYQLDRVERAALRAVHGKDGYARYVKDYFSWARAEDRAPAEAETLRAYVDVLKERYTGGSFAPILAAIRGGLRGAADMLLTGQEAALVSEALRTVKAPRRSSDAVRRDFLLTPEEEAAAIAGMSERDGLVLRFLLGTGARISEALGIRLDQCSLRDRVVICPVVGKGGKTRELRISADLFNAIRGAFGGHTYLFETATGKPLHRVYVSRQIHKAVERTTGKLFSPHCARHTFATRQIAKTHKIQAVSEYLGHSSASITLSMYTHEALTDAELGIAP